MAMDKALSLNGLNGTGGSGQRISCPACGAKNDAENVFCDLCHKALGEFDYVAEAVAAKTGWHERLAERVTGFVGKPHFLVAHALWFLIRVVVKTAFVAIVRRFDTYPFSLLGILLSMEAIFITGFLLISQNRQSAFADKRAELDYEVNVRTYRRLEQIERSQERILQRLDAMEGRR